MSALALAGALAALRMLRDGAAVLLFSRLQRSLLLLLLLLSAGPTERWLLSTRVY